MNYIILIIVLLFILLGFYNLFKKDIFSPSVLLTLSYLLSTFFAFISYAFNLWNFVSDISLYIMLCIIFGILSFGIGEFTIRKLLNKRKTSDEKIYKKYHFDNITYIFVFLFIIITGILLYLNLAKLTGEYKNIPKMISLYRKGSLFGEFTVKYKLNFIVMQLFRCMDILGFILIYIITKNLILKDNIKNNLKYVILLFLICVFSLLINGRTGIMKYMVATIFCWNILNYRIKKKTINMAKLFKIVVICALIGIPMFYLLLNVLGRENSHGFINYITFYIGSPIASLQEFFNRIITYKSTLLNNSGFGSNTFVGAQTILNKFHIHLFGNPNDYISIMFDHRLSSNVFTGLYSYIIDFGIIGVIICQFIYGVFLSVVYYLARNKNKLIYIIFYLLIAICYIDSFRSEKLFTSIFSLNMIIYVVYSIVIIKVLFRNDEGGSYE